MRTLRILATATLLAGAMYGGVNAKLVGAWTGNGITIQIEASGRCRVGAETGTCSSLLSALVYQTPDGRVANYGWKVDGDQLTLTGNGPALVFRRGTGGAPDASATPPATSSAPRDTATAAGPAAGHWAHPEWGLDLALPPGWRVAERDGQMLVVSDTEAGLILLRFMPSTDRQGLTAAYGQGLQESGVNLMPTARLEDFSGRGLAGELGGVGADGQRLRARVIGAPTPFGDALVFVGVTTAEQYAHLAPRVDALAASAHFERPKTPPANLAIAGRYSFLFVSSSGGSYQRQDNVSLCSSGVFYRGGEMSGSGYAGSAATARKNGGRWTADGDGQNGTITLQYGDGQVERLRYQKSGLDIVLNGRKYGRSGDGNCR